MTGPVAEPEVIAQYGCVIGENPLWHAGEQRLYWIDIGTGRLFWFHPESGAHRQCLRGPVIGGFTIQRNGALLLFLDQGEIGLFQQDRFHLTALRLPGHGDSRFNDVIADERGRVFCGVMSTPECRGRLYRLDNDGSFHKVLSDVGCSNGMAFSRNRTNFLHTDSFARTIHAYRFQADGGRLDEPRLVAAFTEDQGLPDGLTMDTQDRIWSALWDGCCVVRLNGSGETEATLPLPVAKVTSVTFGGTDLRDLYVTTAGYGASDEPLAGALFRFKMQHRVFQSFILMFKPSSS